MALAKYTSQRETDKFENVNGQTTVRVTSVGYKDRYSTNDLEEDGDVIYIGKEDKEGNWYVKKLDESSDLAIGHATPNNNDEETYTQAWTNRTSLTYEDYSSAF